MVFQNYALYPHMTVEQNIGFALKLAKLPKDEIARAGAQGGPDARSSRSGSTASPASSPAASASGWPWAGPSCASPSVFLMDEPLSNLDAKLRVQIRAEIARLQRELRTTTIYVTHDQIEAMTMGDRVAVHARRAPAAGRRSPRCSTPSPPTCSSPPSSGRRR